jgi:hypothetical protein
MSENAISDVMDLADQARALATRLPRLTEAVQEIADACDDLLRRYVVAGGLDKQAVAKGGLAQSADRLGITSAKNPNGERAADPDPDRGGAA